MVTHSMQQAVYLGDRLIMLHKGSVAYRYEDAEKQRLSANDLLAGFELLRRWEMFDETAAAVLENTYI